MSRHATGNTVKLLFCRANPYCEGHLLHCNIQRRSDIVFLKSNPISLFECGKTLFWTSTIYSSIFNMTIIQFCCYGLGHEWDCINSINSVLVKLPLHVFFSIYWALGLWTNTAPIPHKEILLLASTRTTIHSALSCFLLRHTSFHTYDIPEEANTGWGCGWCVWGTWLDTSVKQSSRHLAGVPAAPLSALWHFAHTRKHRRLAPVPFVRQPFVCQASVIDATGVLWTLITSTCTCTGQACNTTCR